MFISTVVKQFLMNSMPVIKKSGAIIALGLMLGLSKSKPAEAINIFHEISSLDNVTLGNVQVNQIFHNVLGDDLNGDGRLSFVDGELSFWQIVYVDLEKLAVPITPVLYVDTVVVSGDILHFSENPDPGPMGKRVNANFDCTIGEKIGDLFLEEALKQSTYDAIEDSLYREIDKDQSTGSGKRVLRTATPADRLQLRRQLPGFLQRG